MNNTPSIPIYIWRTPIFHSSHSSWWSGDIESQLVSQVAYFPKPKDSKKHVVVSGKQRIVGADGVQSPEEYNNYAELSLFTDPPRKIKFIEARCNKSKIMPWFRPDGERKTVVGSLVRKWYIYAHLLMNKNLCNYLLL